MPAGFRLSVIEGPHKGLALEVRDPSATPIKIGRTDDRPGEEERLIGRSASPDRDLILDLDGLVSRGHAKIEAVSGGYTITDCKSANGTLRRGQSLQAFRPVRLRDGDVLRFGPDTLVRVEFIHGMDRPIVDGGHASGGVASGDTAGDTSGDTAGDMSGDTAGDMSGDTAGDASGDTGGEASGDTGEDERRKREEEERLRLEAEERARREAEERARRERESGPRPVGQYGKYDLFGSLSSGEATQVDIAVLRGTTEQVALKRFSTRILGPAAIRSLKESAERARKYDHPSIAQVVDAGEQDGSFYVASRLVDGKTLHDLMGAFAKEIDVPLALHLARSICAALHQAQLAERGFLWKNLSPRTVMVDKQGTAVLLYLGFPPTRALIDGDKAMLAGAEARYLSPEQRFGKDIDVRADIYSAGVILYELLLQDQVDPKRKVLLEVDLLRPVPREAAEVTSKAVRWQPVQRFLDIAEMEEAIEAALARLAPDYGPEAAKWMAARL